ncbi:hypothetical protein HDV02_006461, partial [Globomyces sp. JEL0801]
KHPALQMDNFYEKLKKTPSFKGKLTMKVFYEFCQTNNIHTADSLYLIEMKKRNSNADVWALKKVEEKVLAHLNKLLSVEKKKESVKPYLNSKVIKPYADRSQMPMEDSFMLFFQKLTKLHPGTWEIIKVREFSVDLRALRIKSFRPFSVNKYFEYYNWSGINPYTGKQMSLGHYELGKEHLGMTRNADISVLGSGFHRNYDPNPILYKGVTRRKILEGNLSPGPD